MKLFLSLPTACLLVLSGIAAGEDREAKYSGQEDVEAPDSSAQEMLGTYVGAFGERKITICLDRIVGQTVTGYSIVAGNERAFTGGWSKVQGDFAVFAKEPGDHKADGVFKFTFFRKTKSLLGEWHPYDEAIGVRKFNLPARKFVYNPKAGQYPQASTRLLTEKDVENLRNEELRIMRNEIYARHGYSFKLADMREHFDKLDWYMPVAVDIANQLTKVEKDNAALIKRYEKYSLEHYDDFGR
jgi:hypothetical protein